MPGRGSRPPKWLVPVAIGTMAALLWALGSAILAAPQDTGERPSRIALGRTEDGAAIRVLVEGCDRLSVRRVSVLLGTEPVWELRGSAPPGRDAFVVGQSGDPLEVTTPLTEPLGRDVRYTLEVETDLVESSRFTPREVPPIGVLHDGLERTTEGFTRMVDDAWCRPESELPLLGSLAAQLIIVFAGAAFSVVAAGLLGDD